MQNHCEFKIHLSCSCKETLSFYHETNGFYDLLDISEWSSWSSPVSKIAKSLGFFGLHKKNPGAGQFFEEMHLLINQNKLSESNFK